MAIIGVLRVLPLQTQVISYKSTKIAVLQEHRQFYKLQDKPQEKLRYI
jgi:hypothetical protein